MINKIQTKLYFLSLSIFIILIDQFTKYLMFYNKKLFINPEERSFKQFNFKSKGEADEFKLSVSGKTNLEIIKYSEENETVTFTFPEKLKASFMWNIRHLKV